jgi:Glu-tRNA(Gln) amidotransferase subunit E-like FAD-binding protein
MKFKINDIESCKSNFRCNRPNRNEPVCWSCRELCDDKFSSFEKNYSETINLTFPDSGLGEDNTDVLFDEYYYDKKLKINIMPLKRYTEYKESVEKFTFLYLVIKYIKETDIFEIDVRDYIIEQLNEYDEETTFETISYEDIVDIIMNFNDAIPDEILDDILLSAISKEFTNKIQIKNTKLNIVNEDIIKNIIKKMKARSKIMPDGDFNLEYDDWHPCSGCKCHNYNYGKNNCSLGNFCDDYDEDNPCGYRL